MLSAGVCLVKRTLCGARYLAQSGPAWPAFPQSHTVVVRVPVLHKGSDFGVGTTVVLAHLQRPDPQFPWGLWSGVWHHGTFCNCN